VLSSLGTRHVKVKNFDFSGVVALALREIYDRRETEKQLF